MGCDIHSYKEQHIDGKWVTADDWESNDYGRMTVPYEKAFNDRNYNLFGLLAGVRQRGDFLSLTPRGIPFDACTEVLKSYEDWDSDGHSHSYLYLHELKSLKALIDKTNIPISGMKDKEGYEKLMKTLETDNPDYSLIYPYCQGTTDQTAVKFNVNIPASFILGDAIERIIAGFNDISPKADNARFVFWFDN